MQQVHVQCSFFKKKAQKRENYINLSFSPSDPLPFSLTFGAAPDPGKKVFCLFSGTETWLHCVAFAQNNTDIIKDDISSSCNRQISVHHPTSNHGTLILQNMHHLLYKKSGVITFVKIELLVTF